MSAQSNPHRWRFFRAGGFDQVRLNSGADLLALGELDQKLWVALACPTTTVDFDARTLQLLDADGDGRIRAPELIEACRWTGTLLKNPDDLIEGRDALPLAAINLESAEGQLLHDAALNVLHSMGKADAQSVAVADSAAAVHALNQSPFNGDGVITEASAADETLGAVVREIIDTVGSDPDLSGQHGVSQARIDAFFSELAAWSAWNASAKDQPELLPLKEDTAAGLQALRQVKGRIDDYFARCRLAAFDARATAALNRDEKDYAAFANLELTSGSQEIAALPLAQIEGDRPLPLRRGLNPAWADRLESFRTAVVEPLLGERDTLSEEEWRSLESRFAPFEAWQSRKQGVSVEKLGGQRIHVLLSSTFKEELSALVAKDLAIESTVRSLGSLERLVRLHRDLFTLCNNFVSFREFYTRQDRAIFQAGTLYIDQRSCDLCLRVGDVAKHAALAPLSRAFVVYAECRRQGQTMTIAAAVTAGDAENLVVGRNGVFYDRQGHDWDATVTRVVDSPISVREAFWAPYKKLLRFVEEQVARRATEADKSANARLTDAATDVQKAADTGQVQNDKKLDIGIVAALGVAVGGITAAFGALLQAFFGLGIWMPLGLIGVLLAISGPSMAIAWLKLRQRNLAPLLDGNGWAMNSAARINIPFGSSLTQVAVLPRGAARDLRDPFAEKVTPWGTYSTVAGIILLLLFWFSGKADGFLPEKLRRVQPEPPAATAPIDAPVDPVPSTVTAPAAP